jgi:hypothetical protein
MMGSVGIPELLILLMFSVFWLVPVAAAIWALVTLYRIRSEQQAVQVKLDAIERLLRQPS